MSWTLTTIGEHCTVTSSKRFHLSDRTDDGIPFFCSKELIQKVNGQEVMGCDYIRKEFYEEVKAKYGVPQSGDLLITTRGTYGVPYIYRKSDCFYFADGNLTWLKDFDSSLYSKYLYYWVLSHEGQKKIDAIAKGTAQKAVPISSIKELQLSLPPIEIQHRIADILSAYDDLIENNQKQIKLLEEAAQRLYKEWFVDLRFPGWENTTIIDGLPEGWHENILGEIACQSGKNENKNNRSQYQYYLPIDCLPQKSLTYLQSDDVELAESSLIGFTKQDILFGAMRPYFHKVVVARDCGLTRSTCFVINSKKEYMWAYLVMLLFSENTIQYATQISVGTTMPYVRWKDFIQMKILIPEKNILISFQKFVLPIIDQLSELADKVVLLQEARDRLLPKLMSGEVEL